MRLVELRATLKSQTTVPSLDRVALAAREAGISTVSELMAMMEHVGKDGRRRFLDIARRSCGLPSLDELRAQARREASQRAFAESQKYDSEGNTFRVCSEATCTAAPLTPQGVPIEVNDRRWWCPERKHLAGPNDHLPEPERYRIDPRTMSLEPIGQEAERLARTERALIDSWDRMSRARNEV